MSSRSKYWEFLSDRHVMQLGESGIENFKRTVALDYFDWRYPLHRPHMVFWSHLWDLMKRTTMREKMLAASPSFYKFVVRLTWQYALRFGDLCVLGLEEPEYGNPMPVQFWGRLISQDLANTSLEMFFMLNHSPCPKRVIEVGAGYGRTAHALLSLYPSMEYIIVDVEPALSVAKWYLGKIFGNDARLVFLPPGNLPMVSDRWATHAISISTFGEFTKPQVNYYMDQFDRCAEWIYLKQYERAKNHLDKETRWFSEYYKPHWNIAEMEQCPIQSKMLQAVYHNK